jgi:branched-chain amino acid transport system permease protein
MRISDTWNRRYTAVLAAALLVLLLPLLLSNPFHLRIATLVFIYSLATLGLNLLMGVAGQVSLGHAGFLAIGAYAVAIAPARLGLPVWLALVAGVVLAALLAFVVGRPILRLKGHYFAVATLGLGLLVSMVLNNETALTGGPDGIAVPRLIIFGWTLRQTAHWYWVTGVTLVASVWLVGNLIGSPTGRALRAIHDSEVAASVLGVDVARHKLIAFVLSAALAALAGGFLALFDGHVTPATGGFLRSVEFVTMAVLGGMGSLLGSVVGTAILVVLPQALTMFHDYEHVILGLLMMLFMIFLRQGIVPSLANWFDERRAKRVVARAPVPGRAVQEEQS